PLSFLV
nr:Chain C, PKSFLV PEPTIDE [Homo sapiens]3ZMV_D Chain D, PKSFLV PEPTIDE [Homo sapiens]